MMDRYQCWWCKLVYSSVGPYCSYKGKLHKEFTEFDVAEMETIADKIYDEVRYENIGDSNPKIQGENIQLNSSTEIFRNSSTRAFPQQMDNFFSCVNPLLTYCETRSRRLSDSLDNAQRYFEKSEGSSRNSFSVPSSGDICREGDNKSDPSEDPDLGSKEDPLDSTMCEQRKEIAASARKMKDQVSGSSSSTTETPIDGYSVKENESREEVVESDSVADTEAVCVAGPSGLQAQPLGRSKGKRFKCDIRGYGKFFKLRHHLEAHHRTHTGEKPFVCNICNKGFCQRGHLKTHQLTNSGEKTFQCRICPKKFGLKGDLKKHLQTHLDKKPFVCPICGNGYTLNRSLKRHLLTHLDNKPFVCPICCKGFTQNGSLKRHLLNH